MIKLHMKLALGWTLIQVNFDPIQEIGPKVGAGHAFVSVGSYTRLYGAITLYKETTLIGYVHTIGLLWLHTKAIVSFINIR